MTFISGGAAVNTKYIANSVRTRETSPSEVDALNTTMGQHTDV